MIKSIEVKNFRTHKASTLEFDPGVNIIKGTSKNGKSNFTRACKWLLKNRPQGYSFKSWFSSDNENTEVIFNFTEDVFVKRIRGKTDNEYSSIPTGSLKALRGEVPQEILELTQMNDINLLDQHSTFFMIQDTPGERGKKLNAIVNLEIIDTILSKANGRVMSTKSNISSKETELEDKKEKLEQYDFLEEVEEMINDLDYLFSYANVHEETIDRIKEVITSINSSNKKLQSNIEWLKVKSLFTELKTLTDDIEAKTLRVNNLKRMLDTLNTSIHKSTETVHWLEVKPGYEETIALVNKYKNSLVKTEKINKLIHSINKAKTMQNSALQLVKSKQEQYDNTLKTNNFCPLCKRKFD